MAAEEAYWDTTVVPILRSLLLGGSRKRWAILTIINLSTTICLLLGNMHTNYSLNGLFLFGLLGWLFIVAVSYAYTGGGVIDTVLLVMVPAFISIATIGSTTMAFEPNPIWKWSSDRFFHTLVLSTGATLLWGGGFGFIGFVLGKLSQTIKRYVFNRDHAQSRGLSE